MVSECPSLPGCISHDKTKEDSIKNMREAIDAYIAALEEDSLPVPEERFDVLTVAVWTSFRLFQDSNVLKPFKKPVFI